MLGSKDQFERKLDLPHRTRQPLLRELPKKSDPLARCARVSPSRGGDYGGGQGVALIRSTAGFQDRATKKRKSSIRGLKSSDLVGALHLRFFDPGLASPSGPRKFPHHYRPYRGEGGRTARTNSRRRVVRGACARTFDEYVRAGRRLHGHVCSLGSTAGIANDTFGFDSGRS